jgi:hypothetical protein
MERNFMFNLFADPFLASAPPPCAAHHRRPECGVQVVNEYLDVVSNV